MTRFERKKRGLESLKIKSSGGMFDLFDNAIKETWYITDEEYDTLCGCLLDDELDIFVSESLSFSQKRLLLNLIDKYINPVDYRDNQIDRLL